MHDLELSQSNDQSNIEQVLESALSKKSHMTQIRKTKQPKLKSSCSNILPNHSVDNWSEKVYQDIQKCEL